MRKKTVKILLSLLSLIYGHFLNAQGFTPNTSADTGAENKNAVVKLLSADSLASGNYKEILTSFYKLALSNLTGPNKSFGFTTNPYAIMLKHDSSLARYDQYYKMRIWRAFNFNVNAKLDSNNHFAGMSGGVNFAIINKRDETISQAFINDASNNKNFIGWAELNNAITQKRSTIKDTAFRNLVTDQMHHLNRDPTFTFDKLDSSVRTWVLDVSDGVNSFNLRELLKTDAKLSPRKILNASYDSLKNTFQNKLLWTAGVSDTSYSDGGLSKNIKISTELLKGILNPLAASNLELDIKSSVNFSDDTLTAGRNLKRGMFSFEPGINWVIKDKNNQKSFLEFKATSQYTRLIAGHEYANETKEMFTLNGTINIRIINDIWIPIQFKYDPKNGNVFGFLNVTANFTGLSKLF